MAGGGKKGVKLAGKKAEGKGTAAAGAAGGGAGKKEKGKASSKRGKKDWARGGSSGGNEGDLEAELAALALRVKDSTADGNCFFRSVSDQLEGNEAMHVALRRQVVAYIEEHEADYAPFVEDDETFGTYVARMKKDGTWAGYMEVVAASHALKVNLTIYQAGQPRWTVRNHPETAPMLHLSYHDGMHYNSVRCADDYGQGPPKPVVLSGDGLVTKRAASQAAQLWEEEAAAADANAHSAEEEAGAEAEVGGGAGPQPADVGCTAAAEGGGEGQRHDRGAAEGLGSRGAQEAGEGGGCAATPAEGGCRDGAAAPAQAGAAAKQGAGTAKKGAAGGKPPSNNKRCPCGSGQKYKACCGAVAAAAQRRRLAAGGSAAAAGDDVGTAVSVQGDTKVVAQMAALVI